MDLKFMWVDSSVVTRFRDHSYHHLWALGKFQLQVGRIIISLEVKGDSKLGFISVHLCADMESGPWGRYSHLREF